MKVNSIGIDTYRQTMNKPAVDNKPVADGKSQVNAGQKIEIPGQPDKISSSLAIKLKSGAFADMLSAEEKEAIELLFAKYQNGNRGSAYSSDGAASQAHLGNVVDVKL